MLQPRSIHSSSALKDKIFSIDYVLVFSILILGIISMFAMYSTDGGEFKYHTNSHILRFFVFFGLFFLVSLIQIRFWHDQSYLIYILFFILLLGVKYFGLTSSGSKRWLDLYFMNLQPSELMKVGLILFLAKYYHRVSIENMNSIRYLFLPIIALIAPLLLVATQPDLGTSILIAAGGIIVAWLAGVRIKFFVYSSIAFLSLLPVAISFLKPYQKSRILTFLNPERDPLGAGYQIIQSKIAIGSGGLFGKGFLNGSQSYLDYLPEKHTDFIFTLISEELGFFGAMIIILTFCVLIFSIAKISFSVETLFSKVIVFGVSLLIFLYLTLNIGMVCGLLPVVGAPLPLISYGGTALFTILISIGVVLSINVHKNEE
jgi:rod shape determining protein RodA